MEKQKLDFVIDAKVGDFVKNLRTAEGRVDGIAAAIKTMFSGLNTGKTASAQLKAVDDRAKELLATLKRYKAEGKVDIKQLSPAQRANLAGDIGQIKAGVVGARPSNIATAEAKLEAAATKEKIALKKQEEKAAKEKLAVETSAAKAAEAVIKKDLAVRNAATKEQMAMMNRSITLRYALYDVSAATRSASTALLGFSGAVLTAQAAQESAFSSIEKTQAGSETTTQQLVDLKNELIALSTEIPVSFAELSKIGMLGAQLGVMTPDLASFTETVAKFSSVTGVSVEETAMGFGKVASLLGLAGDQYQSLGAAIAKVGVTSSATETQIINTAGQIGAIAKAAGLSASEIIGLSSAFASLKIAPEEARSVTIQTFQAMDAASRSYSTGLGIGNEKLSAFAQISRAGASALLDSAKATGASSSEIAKLTTLSEMTAGDFAKQWGDKAGGAGQVWKTFVTGLGKVDTGKALVQLGLDGIRTAKGLTALGNNAEAVFKQISTAASAGAQGTFLDEAFGTVVEDIAAKLTMLQNSFDNLLASAGSSPVFINTVGMILDAITKLNVALTNLLQKNEFLSAIAAITVGLSALVGAFAAIATVVLAGAGGFLAIRTAFLNYISTTAGAITGTNAFVASILRIPPAALAAAVATRAAATGTEAFAVATAVATPAVSALKWAIRGLVGATGIGLLVVLVGVLVEAFSGAEDATDPLVRGLDEVGKANKVAAEEMAAFSQELIDLVTASSKSVDALANTESALFTLGKSLQEGKNDFSLYSAVGRTNLTNLSAVMSAIAGQAGMDQQSLANSLLGLKNAMVAAGISSVDAFARIDDAIANTGKVAVAQTFNIASLTAGMTDVAKSAGTAKTALEKLDEILQRVFRPMDAVLGVQAALDALGVSLAKNGKLVGYSTEGMRDNFKSLKDVIFAFKDSSNGNLQVFANNLVALRASMVKMGVTSKTAFDEIDKSLAAVKTKGKLTAKQLAAVYSAINDSMVEEQKKNIRTISDYVSDLSGVLSKAFENRYGRQDARDSITSAWISIKEAAEDAKRAIDDANDSLKEINADKKVLEYQLSVAVKYGDTLRAQSIQAKLNDLTKKAADQQAKLTEAQAVNNKSLTDNSKAGIENRSTVRDLIQSGNAYLMTLAQTGMSSAGLKDEAAKLTEEFLAQGTQLGFSRTELEAYTKYFASDFTQVLDSLEPYKNITIEVTTDYAMNAINDFVANAKAALATIPDAMPKSEAQVNNIQTGAPSVATGSGGGGSNSTQSAAAAAEALRQRRLAGAAATAAAAAAAVVAENKARAAALKVPSQAKILATIKQVNELEQLAKEDNGWTAFFNPNRYNYVHEKVKSLRTDIASFKALYGTQWLTGVVGATGQTQLVQGYATGGFISGSGTSTSDSIPAMLSNGEYVIKANAVSKYGVDFMNSLNQMQVQNGSQSGGAAGGSSVVYLSPEDRQLLRAAVDRPIALYTENTKIAQSANAGNVLLAQRGSN